MGKVVLHDALSRIHEYWQPHIAGELNGQLIKLVKFQGEFVWHHHDSEDEMFFSCRPTFRSARDSSRIAGKVGEDFLGCPTLSGTQGIIPAVNT